MEGFSGFMFKKVFVLLCSSFLISVQAEDPAYLKFLSNENWPKRPVQKLIYENGKAVASEIKGPALVQCGAVNWYYPIDGKKDIDALYEGISFEIKGDGSDEWSNVIIGESYIISGRYYFPLKNKEWTTYRVAFADMAPGSDYVMGLPKQWQVGRFAYLAFGNYERYSMRASTVKPHSYQVRNLRLVKKIKPALTGNYKTLPLAEVIKSMKSGKKVLITGFGDSITAGTGLKENGNRYVELLAEKLAEKYQNPGIKAHCAAVPGGHTYQSIAWLDRDLSAGKPDIAVMLIGYNNKTQCQSNEMFRQQLEAWIQRLLIKTEGKTAIILIPTIPAVPRWYTQDEMAQITREVAEKYGCTIAPVDLMIKKLGPGVWKKKYLRDVVHPLQAGHVLIANEIMKCFQ